ncbi:MAG: hypothetical protein BMS9Abin21_068 [Thermodesulfovibrionia bacterium]|nr:MAG: hypothetical protein BMS9Abin21_068 [Thermodesulfovibrionia bacterium]
MSDKSPIELDIERRELVKKPLSVLILIAVLSLCLGALAVYTFKIKQELLGKKQEIILIKSSFDKEKAELISKIRMLEGEHEVRGFNHERAADKPALMPETKNPAEDDKKSEKK